MRLKHAYIIKCEQVIKDEATGEIVELRCTYDPATKSGGEQSGRKVKGTLHWVSADHALNAEVRLYDHLFLKENPDDDDEGEDGADYKRNLNPQSLIRLTSCKVEPSLANAAKSNYQFLRQGYFCADSVDSTAGALVFNRTVSLRDTWAKIEKSSAGIKLSGKANKKQRARGAGGRFSRSLNNNTTNIKQGTVDHVCMLLDGTR